MVLVKINTDLLVILRKKTLLCVSDLKGNLKSLVVYLETALPPMSSSAAKLFGIQTVGPRVSDNNNNNNSMDISVNLL